MFINQKGMLTLIME